MLLVVFGVGTPMVICNYPFLLSCYHTVRAFRMLVDVKP